MLCWQGPGPACKYQGLSHFTLACTVLPSPISSANRQRPPSSTPRRTPSRWKLNRHRAGKGGAHSARVRQSSDAGSGNVASARPAVRPASAFSCALWLPVLVHGRAALLRLIVTSASPSPSTAPALHCIVLHSRIQPAPQASRHALQAVIHLLAWHPHHVVHLWRPAGTPPQCLESFQKSEWSPLILAAHKSAEDAVCSWLAAEGAAAAHDTEHSKQQEQVRCCSCGVLTAKPGLQTRRP
jgi:hypothetical protein